jgi:hypothetical protein
MTGICVLTHSLHRALNSVCEACVLTVRKCVRHVRQRCVCHGVCVRHVLRCGLVVTLGLHMELLACIGLHRPA